MKKFFSLVLALVMALSLTTVAWGAGSAMPAADANGVVTLDPAITYDLTTASFPTGATVIDGNGAKIDVLELSPALMSGLTVKNVTIIGRVACQGNISNVTFDTCVFATGAKIYLHSTGTDTCTNVTVKNCTFEGTSPASTSRIMITNPVNVVIEGNTIADSGYHGVLFQGTISGNTKIVNNTITGTVKDGFRLATFASNAVLELQGNTITSTPSRSAVNADALPTTVKAWNNTWNGAEVMVNDVASAALADISSNATTDASGKLTGGTFTTAPAAADVADGYTVATDVNGNLVVLAGTNAPASAAKGAYYTTDMTNLSVYPSCDTATYKYTLESYTAASENAKTFAKFAIWQTHKVTGAKTIVYTAVYASADSANLAFVNGSQITYLNTVVNTWGGKATPVNAVKVADSAKCGDVFAAGDVGVYTDANGVVYVEKAGFTAYNVGGKMVQLAAALETDVVVDDLATLVPVADTVYTVVHDYAFDTASSAGKTVVTKVSCTECKKSFAFLQGTVAEAIAKFGAGNSELVTIGGNSAYVAGAVATSVPSAGTTTTDKVQSAETFDAGVAMYVGMSVMAAAGGAVVIGKKKD